MLIRRRFLQVLSIVVMLATMFSGFVLPFASAQGADGLKRQFNVQTGKVSFIGPETGRILSASRVLGITAFARSSDPGMALVKRFGPEFGLANPERDLTQLKTNRLGDGRTAVRYQQNYQGIPILGGELIVNTNDNGDLYSINGEISPDLTLPTQPKIDSEQARQTALQAVAKWHQQAPEDFASSEPQLSIYDESLLQPSIRPAELVWRMEVSAKDIATPVRELVLVNAERGHISLHFNQIDTAWNETQKTPSVLNTAQENLKPEDKYITADSTPPNAPLQAGVTWYVTTTGSNSNSCTSVASPCRTINGAVAKATAGDAVKVATGTYTGTGSQVVNISKSITLSGGWNATFTTQNGMSTIDGQMARRGVMLMGAAVGVIDRFIVQNGSACDSGGIRIAGGSTLTLNNSAVVNNNHNPCTGAGGGIENDGFTTLNNSTVSDNTGGGIENSSGTLTLNNSTVSGNFCDCRGSGITNNSTAILNNSTVSGNIANFNGGAGIHNHGTLILNNSTINRNTAVNSSGGGLFNDGTVTIRNTILAMNTATTSGPDCSGTEFGNGTISSLGYNLVGNNSGCAFTPVAGDLVGTSSGPINPQLTPLQNNGGPTFTHALMAGSPAIDAGNPSAPGSGGNACLATDQRGTTRPVGTRCDIGAYEGSVAWVPTVLANTYTAGNSISLPGTFICSQSDPNCAAGDSHAKAAHKYAIGTYNLYATQHGRNSIDNNGMTITSSVHYSTGYANAFWNGDQMVYGDVYGFPLADDVVAHELTHGVTQHESNLFYYYQSGAINESLSDLWGEYYDQTNGQGTDTSGVKWQIGEDVSGYTPFRSMSNPTAFGDPDKMSSANYYEGADDSGGVHTNSGVNNKAIYLMVEGGTFNGKTVTALGWEKTAALYYEVNANLLSSGADYSDLYYALQQACSNLIGQKGITSANCIEVKDALDAVEMNAQPAANFNTDAPYCDSGNPPATIFSDGLESGIGNWAFSNGAFTRWQLDSLYGSYARSGSHFLYADDFPAAVTDATARLVSLTIPSGAYLHFAHAYDFEVSDFYYDGGVLEYSINGGATWIDAGSLIDFNGYKGTIFNGAGNPLSGRSAFVGTSHGYISTRLNLDSLAGTTVSFRWRMGLDQAAAAWGWWVDDVTVYRCPSVGKATLVSPNNNITDQTPTYTWNQVNGSTWYYLWVDGPSGNVIKTWYTSVQANCNGSTCSITPDITLSAGSHTWWVQTWNDAGYGPWSDGMTFIPSPPAPATLISPTGSVATNIPIYTWNEVPGSTWYYLWVDGPSGNVMKQWYTAAQANCNGTTCSVTPTIALSTGTHTWWIQTWNDAGYGLWSAGVTFTPTPPGKATLTSPNGNITDQTPIYTWNEVSDATWYYLWVDGPSGNVMKQWYKAIDICNSSTCSVEPPMALNSGAYTWWIQTWNDAGYGPWSTRMDFAVP